MRFRGHHVPGVSAETLETMSHVEETRDIPRLRRWWTLAELDRTDEEVWPPGLADLVRRLTG